MKKEPWGSMSFRRFIAIHRETAQEERMSYEKQGGEEEQGEGQRYDRSRNERHNMETEQERENICTVG